MAESAYVIDESTGEVVNVILVDPAKPIELPGMRLVMGQLDADIGDRLEGDKVIRRPRPEPPPPPPAELEQARQLLAEAEAAWASGDSAKYEARMAALKAAMAPGPGVKNAVQ